MNGMNGADSAPTNHPANHPAKRHALVRQAAWPRGPFLPLLPLLALAGCLGMAVSPARAENWQRAGYNESMTVYVDKDSVVARGHMTELRTKIVPAVTTRFTHGINREIYDCPNRRSALKTMTAFKGKKMIDHMKAKTLEWEPIEPYGISGLVYQMVCHQGNQPSDDRQSATQQTATQPPDDQQATTRKRTRHARRRRH